MHGMCKEQQYMQDMQKRDDMDIEIILQDAFVKEVQELVSKDFRYASINLVGGAVVDLLEGRKPKDYDLKCNIISSEIDFAKKLGLKYKWDTKVATTYEREGIIVQFLKTDIKDFDFKISQSKLEFGTKQNLIVDNVSFENKILIPVNFTDRYRILNALKRKVHWEKKGYRMEDQTYLSLLNALDNRTNTNS